jgi:arginase family enzyme
VTERAANAVHLNLDEAWAGVATFLPQIEATEWGRRLRFTAPAREMEAFFRQIEPQLANFVLYGSGDFHHLAALWLRRVREPLVLVAFDNHPDWDIRPPRWAAGGWINRALELPQVRRAVIWGCGNFECWWPHQIFGNRKAEREDKLAVHPWADGRTGDARKRRGAILRENWRDHFQQFARALEGENVYVTIDLDCLAPGLAWTNWENGRFSYDDVCWALNTLRQHARVVAGDLCGAYSEPRFARRKQRFAAAWDHPAIALPSSDMLRSVNEAALHALWPALTQ